MHAGVWCVCVCVCVYTFFVCFCFWFCFVFSLMGLPFHHYFCVSHHDFLSRSILSGGVCSPRARCILSFYFAIVGVFVPLKTEPTNTQKAKIANQKKITQTLIIYELYFMVKTHPCTSRRRRLGITPGSDRFVRNNETIQPGDRERQRQRERGCVWVGEWVREPCMYVSAIDVCMCVLFVCFFCFSFFLSFCCSFAWTIYMFVYTYSSNTVLYN